MKSTLTTTSNSDKPAEAELDISKHIEPLMSLVEQQMLKVNRLAKQGENDACFDEAKVLALMLSNTKEFIDKQEHLELYCMATAAKASIAEIYLNILEQLNQIPNATQRKAALEELKNISCIRNAKQEKVFLSAEYLLVEILVRLKKSDTSFFTIAQLNQIFYVLWEGYQTKNITLSDSILNNIEKMCLKIAKESSYTQFALDYACRMTTHHRAREDAFPIVCSLYNSAEEKVSRIQDAREILALLRGLAVIFDDKVKRIESFLSGKHNANKVKQVQQQQRILTICTELEEFNSTRLVAMLDVLTVAKIDDMQEGAESFVLTRMPLWAQCRTTFSELNTSGMTIVRALLAARATDMKPEDDLQILVSSQNLIELLLKSHALESDFKQHHINDIKSRHDAQPCEVTRLTRDIKVRDASIIELKRFAELVRESRRGIIDAENKKQLRLLMAASPTPPLSPSSSSSSLSDAPSKPKSKMKKKPHAKTTKRNDEKAAVKSKLLPKAKKSSRVSANFSSSSQCSSKPKQPPNFRSYPPPVETSASKKAGMLIVQATANATDNIFGMAKTQLKEAITLTRGTHYKIYFTACCELLSCYYRHTRAALLEGKSATAQENGEEIALLDAQLHEDIMAANDAMDPFDLDDIKTSLEKIRHDYKNVSLYRELTLANSALAEGNVTSAEAHLLACQELDGYYQYHWSKAKLFKQMDNKAKTQAQYRETLSAIDDTASHAHKFSFFKQPSLEDKIAFMLDMRSHAEGDEWLDAQIIEECCALAPLDTDLKLLLIETLIKSKKYQERQLKDKINADDYSTPITWSTLLHSHFTHIPSYIHNVEQMIIYGGFVRDKGASQDVDFWAVIPDKQEKLGSFDAAKFYTDYAGVGGIAPKLYINTHIEGLVSFSLDNLDYDCKLVYANEINPFALDITQNALTFCVDSKQISDATGLGLYDLAQGIVRVIDFANVDTTTKQGGDNSIMLLRVARHAAEPNKHVNPVDAKLLRLYADRLISVEPYQLANELGKQFCRGNAVNCIQQLQALGYVDMLFPKCSNLIVNHHVNAQCSAYLAEIDEQVQAGRVVRFETVLGYLLQPYFSELFYQILPQYSHTKDKISKTLNDAIAIIATDKIVQGLKEPKILFDYFKLSILQQFYYQDYLQRMVYWCHDSPLQNNFARHMSDTLDPALYGIVQNKTSLAASNLYAYEGLNAADQKWILSQFADMCAYQQHQALREQYQKMMTVHMHELETQPQQAQAGQVQSGYMRAFGFLTYQQLKSTPGSAVANTAEFVPVTHCQVPY